MFARFFLNPKVMFGLNVIGQAITIVGLTKSKFNQKIEEQKPLSQDVKPQLMQGKK